MKKQYPPELKKMIIQRISNGEKVKQLVTELSISRTTIYDWTSGVRRKRGNIEGTNLGKKYTAEAVMPGNSELELGIILRANCLPSSSNKSKLAAIESIYSQYPTRTICRVLGVNHSSFLNYHFRRVGTTQIEVKDRILQEEISQIFAESEQRFGQDKIRVMLEKKGFRVSVKRISRLMKELSLVPKLVLKKPKPNIRENKNTYLRNRIKGEFARKSMNEVWVSDITEIKIKGNKCYLCVILDLFSRKVISHRIHYRNNSNLTIKTVKQAFESREEPEGVILHSDRGVNYTSYEYTELLKLLKITPSHSNTGNPYDNAVMEAFYSALKREEVNRQEYESLEHLNEAIDKYVLFYKRDRPHSHNNGLSPDEFEELSQTKTIKN